MSAPTQLSALVAGFDRWAEGPFARLRGNKGTDRVFYVATEAANFSALWHAMAWVPVLVSPSPQRLLRAGGTSAALVAESLVVNGPIKSSFRRARPVLEEGTLRPHRLRQPRSTSFPSGHASAAMVAALVMGRGRHRLARGALFALAAFVASSRIYVKIHHASDVLGGALIGIVLGRVLRRLVP